jgi:hypothetical protein
MWMEGLQLKLDISDEKISLTQSGIANWSRGLSKFLVNSYTVINDKFFATHSFWPYDARKPSNFDGFLASHCSQKVEPKRRICREEFVAKIWIYRIAPRSD